MANGTIKVIFRTDKRQKGEQCVMFNTSSMNFTSQNITTKRVNETSVQCESVQFGTIGLITQIPITYQQDFIYLSFFDEQQDRFWIVATAFSLTYLLITLFVIYNFWRDRSLKLTTITKKLTITDAKITNIYPKPQQPRNKSTFIEIIKITSNIGCLFLDSKNTSQLLMIQISLLSLLIYGSISSLYYMMQSRFEIVCIVHNDSEIIIVAAILLFLLFFPLQYISGRILVCIDFRIQKPQKQQTQKQSNIKTKTPKPDNMFTKKHQDHFLVDQERQDLKILQLVTPNNILNQYNSKSISGVDYLKESEESKQEENVLYEENKVNKFFSVQDGPQNSLKSEAIFVVEDDEPCRLSDIKLSKRTKSESKIEIDQQAAIDILMGKPKQEKDNLFIVDGSDSDDKNQQYSKDRMVLPSNHSLMEIEEVQVEVKKYSLADYYSDKLEYFRKFYQMVWKRSLYLLSINTLLLGSILYMGGQCNSEQLIMLVITLIAALILDILMTIMISAIAMKKPSILNWILGSYRIRLISKVLSTQKTSE